MRHRRVLRLAKHRESGSRARGGALGSALGAMLHASPRVATRPVRLLCAGPSRGGFSLPWIGLPAACRALPRSGTLPQFATAAPVGFRAADSFAARHAQSHPSRSLGSASRLNLPCEGWVHDMGDGEVWDRFCAGR